MPNYSLNWTAGRAFFHPFAYGTQDAFVLAGSLGLPLLLAIGAALLGRRASRTGQLAFGFLGLLLALPTLMIAGILFLLVVFGASG